MSTTTQTHKLHPTRTRCQTQAKLIQRHLEAGNRITAITAIDLFGCLRLAARIRELRKQGHNILTTKITTRGGARIAQYHIPFPEQPGHRHD